ncbi:MAG: ATPase, T2SS/T4P/T4SS family [Candidatus Shapirobacteria bacterium]|nr:ATPase, T2SS/T4P/T4SS family [Candidatus Shapirobacteria bacterium]
MPTAQKLNSQAALASNTIADVLASAGFLSEDKLKAVKLEQVNTGRSLKQIILEHNFANDEQVSKAEAQIYNIPFIDPNEKAISPESLSLIPRSVAERYNLIPFDYNRLNNELSVALANPLDLEVIEFIEKKAKAKIKPFMATTEKIQQAVASAYAQTLSADVKAALKEVSPGISETQTVDITSLGNVIREAPVAKIVATILEFAIKSRSSDVHIEPQEDRTRVRYRIDGILHEKLILPKKVHDAVVSRIKILSGMKIDEKRVPQDGRFNFKADNQEVDLRVSSLPTVFGEKIVMRLLKKSGGVPDLPELGLRGRALKNLEDSILRPHGIILICGPTGSGKTTTLYSVLSRINTSKVNIVTLEDPVEYQIQGVNQVQVNPAAGLSFASGMRSFLRQDPNIIMVGEIRDKETTELAIQASLTGHLVFSTLHTNDATGAIPRLLDLGGEPFLLASAMTCIVAQRVLRKICEHCKESYTPLPEVIEDIKKSLGNLYPKNGELKLFRGKKCSECNNTGYIGRVGIFEVLPISEKIARLTLERAAANEIQKQALEEGMISLEQDGHLKAIEGITTIEEVLRVARD